MKYLMLLLLAITAHAGKSGYCYKIEPYGDGWWVVKSKAPRSLFYKELHHAIVWPDDGMCDLNPLLVQSTSAGRDMALEVDASGVDRWEASELGKYRRCEIGKRRTEAPKQKPKPVKQETVEICPL